MLKYLALFAITLFAIAAPPHAACLTSDEYGTKVHYELQKPLNFPDFSLTFVGTRRVQNEKFKRGFLYYDFTLAHGDKHSTISWSEGTGDIGPTQFEFDGKSYLLELKQSDLVGNLGDDKLVLWTEELFTSKSTPHSALKN